MKKVIPPFLFLLCIVFMVVIKNLIIIREVIPKPYNYIGIVLIVAGLIITIIIRKQFKKNNTEIHTFKNPKKLVTTGFFKISRNPIYLGFSISLLGVWVLLGTILPIVGCLLFIIITNSFYIPYEERAMKNLFGEAYNNYKLKVRRWL